MKYFTISILAILLLAFSPADIKRIENVFLEDGEVFFKSTYKADSADDLNKEIEAYLSLAEGIENLTLINGEEYEFDLKGHYVDYMKYGGNGNTVNPLLFYAIEGKGHIKVDGSTYTVTLRNMYFNNRPTYYDSFNNTLTRKRKRVHEFREDYGVVKAIGFISKYFTDFFILKEVSVE